jgi:hypothetical protein
MLKKGGKENRKGTQCKAATDRTECKIEQKTLEDIGELFHSRIFS